MGREFTSTLFIQIFNTVAWVAIIIGIIYWTKKNKKRRIEDRERQIRIEEKLDTILKNRE